MTVYKFENITFLQSDDWSRYMIVNDHDVISKGISSVPLTREDAKRIIENTGGITDGIRLDLDLIDVPGDPGAVL